VTRKQVVGFAVVVVLLAAAFVVQAVRAGSDPVDAELVALRERAALAPCPSGLSAELPDLELACLGGGPAVRMQATGTGRPTLVNAWGSWCGPCKREIPELVQFAAQAAGKVDVVGVLSLDSFENGLDFSLAAGIRYPSLVDDDGAFFRTYSAGPPVTVFLAADGRVAHVERGEIESLQEMLDLVRTHLGVTV
jgi:cytochrome c biogenesis protein CcmG, thiol:disulfide interchange protein DsbE